MNAKTNETGRALTSEEMMANIAAVTKGMNELKLGPELGPPKLSEEAIELFKAFEAEVTVLRRRLNQLEENHHPFKAMLERWFNQELERRLGMRLELNKSPFKDAGSCEVSPLEVMRFKYNIGA